jgi:choice-of-anchor A domain-containing protein
MFKKIRRMGAASMALLVALGTMAFAAGVVLVGSGSASASVFRRAVVTDLTAFSCSTSTEWHFIMTGLSSPSSAARKIHVRWSNGREADIALDGVAGSTAHYFLAMFQTSTVTEMSAVVPVSWTGGLRLFTAPQGGCQGTYTYDMEPDGHVHIHLHVHIGAMEIECEYEHQLGSAPHLNVHIHNGDAYEYQEEYQGYTADVNACIAATFGAASTGTVRACVIGNVGEHATQGRFGYAFSNTVAAGRVVVSTLSNGGTAPFASIDTGGVIPRWSDLVSLGATTIKWSFGGTDDLGVVKGTVAAPLTISLPISGTLVNNTNRCPYVPPAGCRQGSLSSAADNNLLIRTTASLAGLRAGGRLSVGGNATGADWLAGTQLPTLDTRIDAAFNGSVNTATGGTPHGSMSVAGAITGTLTAVGSVRTEATPTIGVDAAWAGDASSTWGTTANTGPMTVIDAAAATKTIRFEGENALTNVFSVTAAVLATARTVQIKIPTGSLAVINVTGTSYLQAGNTLSVAGWDGSAYTTFAPTGTNAVADAYRTHVVWNFPAATSVDFGGATLDGSLLAPKAAVKLANSTINGSVFADSMVNAGTTGAYSTALRCAPLPEGGLVADPNPVTTTTTAAAATTTTVAATTTTVAATTATTVAAATTTTVVVNGLGVAPTTTTVAPTTTTTVAATTTTLPAAPAAPSLAVCYEGAIGSHATQGRYGYLTNVTVGASDVTTNTISATGFSVPFTRLGVGQNQWVWSVPFTLQGTDMVWTFDGIYADGGDFDATSATLSATGVVVTDTNVCDPNLLTPITLIGVCYAQATGATATRGRFWYETDYTITAAGVRSNTMSNVTGTPPFAEMTTDGSDRVESDPVVLGATGLTWSFDGVDAIAHRTGVLTATLTPTGHVVAAGEQCGIDAAADAVAAANQFRPT